MKFVTPRLQLAIRPPNAYCGRCGGLIGSSLTGERIHLVHHRGYGWVYRIIHRRAMDDGVWEFELKRRRHTNPAVGGPSTVNGAEALPGAIVLCPNPRCKARQWVPPR